MAWKLRGTGVRHTLPFVGRFAGLWFLVTTVAILVAAASTYMVFAERMDDSGRFVDALALQTVLSVLAVGALAVFTTHRLAGPWIAVRRALEAVRDGRLDERLRIRTQDVHIRDVERAFNEMIDTVQGRLANPQRPPGAEAPSTPPQPQR